MSNRGFNMRETLGIYLRGAAMGVADLIPGVSGGTVALVTGIYDRLVAAIASVGWPALRLLLRGEIAAAWRSVDGGFLLTLFAGIATSVLSLAGLLHHLLETTPQLVWALFLGLIAASILHMARVIGHWRADTVVALAAGAAIAWWITHLPPMSGNDSLLWVAVCGMLAISAWILPGISGSFVLLVLGMYEYVIGAIRSLDLPVLAIFAIGCGTGLLLFTRALRWALARFHAQIIALLTGFLIGSLPLLWPWQDVADARVLLRPAVYEAVTGREPFVAACVMLTLLGVALVLALELASRRREL